MKKIIKIFFCVLLILFGIGIISNIDERITPWVILLLILIGIIILIKSKMKRKNEEISRQKEQAMERQRILENTLDEIKNKELQPVSNAKAIMKDGEEAYSAFNAGLYEMKSKGTIYKGATIRVRVAKGVSVGLGGGKSAPEKELIQVSEGQFIITNQRVIFAGDSKSFEIKLSNLTYFDKGFDYITFHAGTRNYTVGMNNAVVQISEAILNKLLK